MAIVTVPGRDLTLRDEGAVANYLERIGIDYERWTPDRKLPDIASAEEILDAYAAQVQTLKQRGGYVTADVIDVRPDTPGLDQMLARFNREHWHTEDEVRFVVEGHGIFWIHPIDAPIASIEVEPGDLIRVPKGTRHWFTLCDDRRIRAIRLFQDPSGWTPHYPSNSPVDDESQSHASAHQ
jgi:1,2-dihydroxy-3-keto-5-methylthiopentene dioxygenase